MIRFLLSFAINVVLAAVGLLVAANVFDGVTVSNAVREKYPHMAIWWGGWFPSAVPELFLNGAAADARPGHSTKLQAKLSTRLARRISQVDGVALSTLSWNDRKRARRCRSFRLLVSASTTALQHAHRCSDSLQLFSNHGAMPVERTWCALDLTRNGWSQLSVANMQWGKNTCRSIRVLAFERAVLAI